ncbi:RNA pseudouridine synthase [Paenibacillus sp. 598K]|uniref:RluA family pseudouridine synthase n=1 Tax=Paenibacillus sp. 598K TaxID=1117987 RepID=UPI000FF90EC2|nr:RluA family pseudouridine synthase [Paenibacillus sp. 598K]GBF73927.1 RNA pseudouridine synthase [Paenibacillus sp. 598K]
MTNDWLTARRRAKRMGEWLELPLPFALSEQSPRSAHNARLLLLEASGLPAKWINRLFSTGGIQPGDGAIRLHVFPAAELSSEPLYRLARQSVAGSPEVLFEDDYCLVLNKPAGMNVHPARPGEAGTLDEAALRHMLATNQQAAVRHVHRLDQETSGPVLYAKNDLAQWLLDEALRNKSMGREYVAVAQGRIRADQGTLTWPIGRDRHQAGRRRVAPGGDPAVTHYEVIGRARDATLVRVRLETGRTHQIRVHLSHLGHPLVGDRLYGGASALLSHQALHGERLVFEHPWTQERVCVDAVRPPWLSELWTALDGR